MSSGSFVQVTSGVGPKLATGPTYTENSNINQDQKVIAGLPYLATYTISAVGGAAVSAATANSHLLEVMAGSTLNVYVKRISVWQVVLAGALTVGALAIVRLTSAGSSGTGATAAALDGTDGAAGAAATYLPASKGSEATTPLSYRSAVYLAAWPTTGGISALIAEWDWGDDLTKALRIPAGTANGIAVKNPTGVASASLFVEAMFIEAPF